MNKIAWILLLLAGCGTAPERVGTPASRPAQLEPQKRGEVILLDRLALGEIQLHSGEGTTHVRVKLHCLDGQEITGRFRLRYFDQNGNERRTSKTMAWKKFSITPGTGRMLEETYPSGDISGIAVDYVPPAS